MLLTVVSSLDTLCRQRACEILTAAHPAALLVVHDLLDDGVVVRRVFGPDTPVDREENRLEHGCLSCTVRLDVVPTVERLLARGAGHIIIALPPAVPAAAAVNALKQGLNSRFTVGSVMLACAPDIFEDQIWDHHTLFESGFTPTPEDQRTPGEFLIGELAFSDTVLLADPLLFPVDPDQRARGEQLLGELAPHARLTDGADVERCGNHDYAEAMGRTVPGSVRIPAGASASPFVTVTQRVRRPLHAERFRDALAALAEGCCWLRGRLWIATAPGCRIAIQGIGPRVWLENTGPWLADQTAQPRAGRATDSDAYLDWHPEFGDRGTVIAATGEHLDPAKIARLLEDCQLTDAEMDACPADLPDPFDFSLTS
jgi:G3E family GTPase